MTLPHRTGTALLAGTCGLAEQAFLAARRIPGDKLAPSPPAARAISVQQATSHQHRSSSFGAGLGFAACGAIAASASSSARASRTGAGCAASKRGAAAAKTKPRPAALEEAIREGRIKRKPSGPAKFILSQQVGVTSPLGFFDPLGFAKESDEGGFNNLRRAEIKHGRVAMLATVGSVIQHYVRLPGFGEVPSSASSGLAALQTVPGENGFAFLFLIIGFLEVNLKDDGRAPGDFGDPLGLGRYAVDKKDMRNKELNNGRMAMVSALGIIVAELATGKDGMQQLGL